MPVHRLGGTDVALVGIVAEGELVCRRFRGVVQFRAGAVGIDVGGVLGLVETGFGQTVEDALRLRGAVRSGRRGVEGVAGGAVTHDFGVNLCAALLWRGRNLQESGCRSRWPSRNRLC